MATRQKKRRRSKGTPVAVRAGRRAAHPDDSPGESAPVEPPARASRRSPLLVVGMGASAGGLEAFQKFFDLMPPDSGLAFILVQHLDPDRDSALHEILATHTRMPVVPAADGAPIEGDHVYVIPPNASLTVEGGRLRVKSPLETRIRRTPIDVFFASLAVDQGENAVCVVLSGAGSDGTVGLRQVKEHGGLTMAQAPGSAKYESMPSSPVPSGLVDHVLPVEAMPGTLLDYARVVKGLRRSRADGNLDRATIELLPKITASVFRRTGHEFGQYRQKTIARRVQRRMLVHQLATPHEYLDRLGSDPAEAELLFKELLIGVTHFFRDPEAFEALRREVIPAIVNEPERDEVRAWVPACSTGEETYSIAMLIREEMDRTKVNIPVRVFGGDIDDEGLDEARQARYPESIARHVSPERLERFFVKKGHVYQVTKQIRDMCIFSNHNLIKNPPFSRLDLISCRNFMIYLETPLQERLLPLFHYALRPKGYLFLGPSESIGKAGGLFRPVDKKSRIFQRKDSVAVPPFGLSHIGEAPGVRQIPQVLARPPAATREVGKSLEGLLLSRFAPPAVLVNEEGDILYISGRTGEYLEPAAGAPQTNILSMARRGLRLELRAALHSAAKKRTEVVQRNVEVGTNGGAKRVTLIVRPLTDDGSNELFTVIFDDTATVPKDTAPPPATRVPARRRKADEHRMLQSLESELHTTRDRLNTTVEELESANEELRSSNEELLSMNEELQSSNEELQSSKEELQALNEELETVNAELHKKVEELDHAYSDLQNLFESTQIATIFVDKKFRIKKFTPAATDVLNVIESDIGRPVGDITARFADSNLLGEVTQVLRTLVPRERVTTTSDSDTQFLLRITPYRTVSNVIDGVVLTFQNVTDLKRAERATQSAREYAESVVQAVRQPLLVLDQSLHVRSANRAFCDLFGLSAARAEGRPLNDLDHGLSGSPALRGPLRTLVSDGTPFEGIQVTYQADEQAPRTLLADGRRLVHPGTGEPLVLLTIDDITARKSAEEQMVAHRDRLDSLVKERTSALEHSHEMLRTSERMAALGSLSAGLGHDMSNLLMPVRARLDSIAAGSTGPRRERDLRDIMVCLEQLQHLASGLRLLVVDPSAKGTGQSVSLAEWWADVHGLLRNILPQGVALHGKLAQGLPPVRVGKHHLTQAVFNLVKNSADAMAEGRGGTVTVWTEHSAREGVVKVGVSDDGPGMSEETRKRCLEPFYSTKSRGISTGLGLSFVQGVVAQAGGSVHLESQQGKGTTFVLSFPVATDEPGAPRAGQDLRAVVTIDNQRVKGLVSEALRQAGYSVVDSTGPGQAPLWVVEQGAGVAGRAAAFVRARPNRFVLMVGKDGAGVRKATVGRGKITGKGDFEARIIEVGLKFSSVRQGLERIGQHQKAGDREELNADQPRQGDVR